MKHILKLDEENCSRELEDLENDVLHGLCNSVSIQCNRVLYPLGFLTVAVLILCANCFKKKERVLSPHCACTHREALFTCLQYGISQKFYLRLQLFFLL